MPNLEQTGLLEIDYLGLKGSPATTDLWRGARTPPWRTPSPAAACEDRARCCWTRCAGRRRSTWSASARRSSSRSRRSAQRPAPRGAIDEREPRSAPRCVVPAPGRAGSPAQPCPHVRPGQVRPLPAARRDVRPAVTDERRGRAGHRDLLAVLRRRRSAAHRGLGAAPQAAARPATRLPRVGCIAAGRPATGVPAPTTRCRGPTPAGAARGSTRSSSDLYREVGRPRWPGWTPREHTAQVDPRSARGARGAVPQRRAAAAVLLADDGARRRHRRA